MPSPVSRTSNRTASGLATALISTCPPGGVCRTALASRFAGDHDGADAHGAEALEPLLDAALHHVLEVDDAEHPGPFGDGERRASRVGDPRRIGLDPGWQGPAQRGHLAGDGLHRALPDDAPVDVAAAHARLRAEGDEGVRSVVHLASAQPVFLLRQHHDRATLRRLVGEARQLRRVGQVPGFLATSRGSSFFRLSMAAWRTMVGSNSESCFVFWAAMARTTAYSKLMISLTADRSRARTRG